MKKELDFFHHLALTLLEDEITNPVSKRIPVENLYEQLDIRLSDAPISETRWQEAIQAIVLATPKSASKAFFNQLYGGRQPKAAIGDLLAVLLNANMHTYKVAGVQVGLEKEIIERSCERINYGEKAGGTFPMGGSMSNFSGMLMARDAYNKDIRNIGVSSKMIAYTSQVAHYSISKNAAFCGIGRDNVRHISTDNQGAMCLKALEEQIIKDMALGYTPFFVNATAGTTVLGAFDPIDNIAAICKKYRLWLHVDGALGGSVLFSDKYKHLIKGVEQADSFCYNAHKMLGAPVTCSILLVKDKKHLYQSFSNDVNYLYQTDTDDYNPGKTSFHCGRRNNSFKFWTLWKAIGRQGLAEIVEKEFHLADIARTYVRNHPDYTLYSFDNSTAVCFNYKNINAKTLCTSLYHHNQLMVGFGTFAGQEFIRLVTINANNSEQDILRFFEILETHAVSLSYQI